MKKTIDKAIWPITIFRKMIMRKNSYLHEMGWINSMRKGYPCKQDGTEIPWMNFAVIHFLEERLKKDMRLFEFGSGYSTSFYARLVSDVTSIEYDQQWMAFIEDKIPDNARVIFKEKDVNNYYCRAITESTKKYDVVIVDGRDRVNCIIQSIDCLSDQGVIILDDSQRQKYQPGIDFAKEQRFRSISFQGLKPPSYGTYETTILYRNNNCFGI